MSVTPPIEGNPESGANGTNQAPSQPDQPSAEQFAKMQAELTKAQQQIGALQSDKDRAAFRAEQKADTVAKQIEKLLPYLPGMTAEQVREATRQSVLDEVVSERIGKTSTQAEPIGTATTRGIADELADIDKALGLPASDPRSINLRLNYGNDKIAYLQAAVVLRDSLKNQSSPTPAEQPLPTQAAVSGQRTATDTELKNQYVTRRDAIMNQQPPLGQNAKLEALTNLKAEFRGKGLQLR